MIRPVLQKQHAPWLWLCWTVEQDDKIVFWK